MRGAVLAFPPYGQYSTPRLLDAYRLSPARLERALGGLSPDERRARARPGKWSVNEIVCHVADSEIIGAARLRLMLAQPGATLPAYDQDRWAAALAYQERTPAEVGAAVALFSRLRETSGPLFESASEPDWTECWGVHQEYGRITLRNLLELYADHGERHLEQICRLRELLGHSTPSDLSPLLPDRLY